MPDTFAFYPTEPALIRSRSPTPIAYYIAPSPSPSPTLRRRTPSRDVYRALYEDHKYERDRWMEETQHLLSTLLSVLDARYGRARRKELIRFSKYDAGCETNVDAATRMRLAICEMLTDWDLNCK
ncbi:hypothetical protein AA313_de0210335 [Arthrobotrys entomopaga]|nr:hypothetical protein AA313_de0210335 [Arthrobotrys entomopaga]